jgi:hypothetical protein
MNGLSDYPVEKEPIISRFLPEEFMRPRQEILKTDDDIRPSNS